MRKHLSRLFVLLLSLALLAGYLPPPVRAAGITRTMGPYTVELTTAGIQQDDGTYTGYDFTLTDYFSMDWLNGTGTIWSHCNPPGYDPLTVEEGGVPGMEFYVRDDYVLSLAVKGKPTKAGVFDVTLLVQGIATAFSDNTIFYSTAMHLKLRFVVKDEAEIPLTKYDLWVDGKQVTSGNRDDILKDGSFTYDYVKNELLIKGNFQQKDNPIGYSRNADDRPLIHSKIADLTIRVDNDLELLGNMILEADTTILGSGSLNIHKNLRWYTTTDPDQGRIIYVTNGATLTIDGVGFDVTGGSRGIGGNYSGESLVVIHSNIHGNDYYGAVCGFTGGITLIDCKVTQPEGAVMKPDGIYDNSETVYPSEEVTIKADSTELWVDNVQVTGENQSDILGDGIFSYSPGDKTLFIKGDYIQTTAGNLIRSQVDGLTIEAQGEVHLAGQQSCIALTENTTITGSKLFLTAGKQAAISINGGKTLTLSYADLEAGGFLYGIRGTGTGTRLVSNQSNFTASGQAAAVTGFGGGITLDADSKIVAPVSGTIKDGAIVGMSDTVATEAEVKCIRSYPLKLGGVTVTEENMTDPTGDGAFTFDGNKTLTIHKDFASQYYDIESGIKGLTVVVEKNLTLSTIEPAMGWPIMAKEDMTITGPGKLNIIGVDYNAGIGAEFGADLTFRNADVTVTGGNFGISGSGTLYPNRLIVDNSTVHVTLSAVWNSGISGFHEGIELLNCKIAEPEGGKIHEGDGKIVQADGVTNATTIRIEPLGPGVSGSAAFWNDVGDVIPLLYDKDATYKEILTDWKEGAYLTSPRLRYTGTSGAVTETNIDGKAAKAQTFSIPGVAAGDYQLVLLKPGKYVPKVLPVTMGENQTEVHMVRLWRYGDVTGDGIVDNAKDVQQINNWIAGKPSGLNSGTEQDQADRMLAANVTFVTVGDEMLNAADVLQIQRYIAGKSSAFDSIP